MLCYALLYAMLESLEPKNPFYKWKGKEEKQIVSFFPTQLVEEGERFWGEVESVVML